MSTESKLVLCKIAERVLTAALWVYIFTVLLSKVDIVVR